MVENAAHVQSVDALREFRSALIGFVQEARSSLVDIDLELRRGMEWLLETQPEFWRSEVRRGNDALGEAKQELSRARMVTLPGGGTPSCMEEKKAVARAQARLEHAEDKVKVTRSWGQVEDREVADYQGRASQLSNVLDADMPKAIAFLDRAIAHLEAYLASGAQGDGLLPKGMKLTPVEPPDDLVKKTEEESTAAADVTKEEQS